MNLPEASFFRMREAYNYGVEVAQTIKEGIKGRSLFNSHEAGLLAQIVHDGRHSDHIEIGTFFGASAILAAMIKKRFGLHGIVHCIDPLEMRKANINDWGTGIKATSDIVMENAGFFEVGDIIKLHLAKSSPWPLGDRTFGTGYIDGEHWNGQPMRDWLNMKKYVKYAIVFDDYARGKSEVVEAVVAAINDPDWTIVHIAGTMAFLRKRE